MAYGGNYNKGKSKATSLRLTGLFKTKRQGLLVGSVRDDVFDALIEKVREAKKAGRGLSFFVWKNDPNREGPSFSLTCDVERPQEERKPAGKRIQDDDGDFGAKKDDSLFDDD